MFCKISFEFWHNERLEAFIANTCQWLEKLQVWTLKLWKWGFESQTVWKLLKLINYPWQLFRNFLVCQSFSSQTFNIFSLVAKTVQTSSCLQFTFSLSSENLKFMFLIEMLNQFISKATEATIFPPPLSKASNSIYCEIFIVTLIMCSTFSFHNIEAISSKWCDKNQ